MVLCRLVNILLPGSVKKINDSKIKFKQMENVSNFLKAARKLGVANHDCFETVDLFEQKDLMNVIKCMVALGHAVQKNPHYKGPVLGKKEPQAEKAKNRFYLQPPGKVKPVHHRNQSPRLSAQRGPAAEFTNDPARQRADQEAKLAGAEAAKAIVSQVWTADRQSRATAAEQNACESKLASLGFSK
jgi:hypothetical protein